MKLYKVTLIVTLALGVVAVYAKVQSSLISALKEGEEAICVGTQKTIETKLVGTGKFANGVEIRKKVEEVRVHKGYRIDLTFNASNKVFEATEQDSSDLGGYSPIPYPCEYIGVFSSSEFNVIKEQVFFCKDDTYASTQEVYLLKNCSVQGVE